MILRLYIPRDAAAVSVGADEVAVALEAAAEEQCRGGNRPDRIARPVVAGTNGRGFDRARSCFWPVEEADAESVLKAAVSNGAHPLRLGLADELPWLKRQTRLTFARCGIIDPRSVDDYRAHDGYKGLERALSLGSDGILADVKTSGLRGRGGAGFPTAISEEPSRTRLIRNTSFAMPMRVTAALLPIV
jgi:formate dehydrogenase iron-sulfur subunit